MQDASCPITETYDLDELSDAELEAIVGGTGELPSLGGCTMQDIAG